MDNEQSVTKREKKLPSWVNKKPLYIWPFISIIVAAPYAYIIDNGVGMLLAIVFAPVAFLFSFFHIPTGVFFAKINKEEINKGHTRVVPACLFIVSVVMAVLLTLISAFLQGPHPQACFDICTDMTIFDIAVGPIIVSIDFLFMSLIGAARYIYLVKFRVPKQTESSSDADSAISSDEAAPSEAPQD